MTVLGGSGSQDMHSLTCNGSPGPVRERAQLCRSSHPGPAKSFPGPMALTGRLAKPQALL